MGIDVGRGLAKTGFLFFRTDGAEVEVKQAWKESYSRSE
jgi:hypothetical protein